MERSALAEDHPRACVAAAPSGPVGRSGAEAPLALSRPRMFHGWVGASQPPRQLLDSHSRWSEKVGRAPSPVRGARSEGRPGEAYSAPWDSSPSELLPIGHCPVR